MINSKKTIKISKNLLLKTVILIVLLQVSNGCNVFQKRSINHFQGLYYSSIKKNDSGGEYRRYLYINSSDSIYLFTDTIDVNYLKLEINNVLNYKKKFKIEVEKINNNSVELSRDWLFHNGVKSKSYYRLRVFRNRYELIEYRKYNPPLTDKNVDIELKEIFIKKIQL